MSCILLRQYIASGVDRECLGQLVAMTGKGLVTKVIRVFLGRNGGGGEGSSKRHPVFCSCSKRHFSQWLKSLLFYMLTSSHLPTFSPHK